MKLSDLTGSGKISGFSRDIISERLQNMGCEKGNSVRFILKKGSLCEYRIGETLIAIKKEDCGGIFVE